MQLILFTEEVTKVLHVLHLTCNFTIYSSCKMDKMLISK